MLNDMPLEALEGYRPARREPSDFDAFWKRTIAETHSYSLSARFEPVDYGLETVATYDVTFAGFGGAPIKGWFLHPAPARAPLPCVIQYVGYGGGRGFPGDWLLWSSAGFANLVMDTRGQGSSWRHGDTPDPYGSGPHHPGFMTAGILNPDDYYYRRLFVDGVRAVEAARSHPLVDPDRLAVAGRSQGGGIALAVAALAPEVAVAMPDVPFLCHFRRATEITDEAPYAEIAAYCRVHRHRVEQVFATLAYFDGVNFAPRAQAAALFSAGLMDEICPPSTVFAAYNHYAGPKQIEVFTYNYHEGGESFHQLAQVRYLRRLWLEEATG